MIKNEFGFTYPLTITILMSFLIFFSVQFQQLLTEKKMFAETKIIMIEEYYMLSSAKKIETKFQTGEIIPAKGSFPFLKGYVNFQADLPQGSSQKITFTLQLATGETAIANGYYDKNLKKLIKWVEKN